MRGMFSSEQNTHLWTFLKGWKSDLLVERGLASIIQISKCNKIKIEDESWE